MREAVPCDTSQTRGRRRDDYSCLQAVVEGGVHQVVRPNDEFVSKSNQPTTSSIPIPHLPSQQKTHSKQPKDTTKAQTIKSKKKER